MSTSIVIVAAKRTPIGSFGGYLSSVSPSELGSQCLSGVLQTLPETISSDVSQVIVGHVLAAGHGQNMARQIAMGAGLNESIPSYTINHVCGSGMQAIISGVQAIKSGDATCIIAGGVEVMSQAPFLLTKQRWGQKLGHETCIDSIIKDGLWDCFNDIHMGITAENVAEKWNISRMQQDEFACHSQQKAYKAQQEGLFKDEIIPIEVKKRKETVLISEDEFIKPNTTLEALSKLRPVFKAEGTVTAGNASGINDGAAFVVMMTEQMAQKNGLTPLAKISSTVSVGYTPAIMGASPIEAIKALYQKSGLTQDQVDCFEINEAFASQSLAIIQDLNLPAERVNPRGGAIALGHPIGASGTRIVVTLIHQLLQAEYQRGVASLCIGGGQSSAIALEK